MEFSGSLRAAFEKRGVVALPADLGPCDVGGRHFPDDIREVIDITKWQMVVFFPNCCFQQLRADEDCLPSKIRDGRAYWGCVAVLWCHTAASRRRWWWSNNTAR